MLHIRSGNRHAFTALYQRYCKNLLYYFSRLLQYDKIKAEDMLHDLFMKIVERPDLFNTSKNFKAWIYQSATNMCRNEWRNQSTRNEILQKQAESTTPHYHPATESKIDDHLSDRKSVV